MFSEPQSVTVNAIANDLQRVSFGNRTGIFEDVADGQRLTIAHQSGKRSRRTVRFDITKVAADPLLDGVSRQYSMSAYLVVDHPLVGFDTAEIEDNISGLTDWCGVVGNLTKVVNGES